MLTISAVSSGVSSDFPVRKSLVESNNSSVRAPASSVVRKVMVVVAGRIYRECIERLLQSEDRKIVGKCEIPSQMHNSFDHSDPPDLFVVSLGDGEFYLNTISSIREMRSRVPRAKWILLCRRADDVFSREAVAAGVDGLLFEDSPGELLQHVAALVLQGYQCVPSSLPRPVASAEPGVTFEATQMRQIQRPGGGAEVKIRPLIVSDVPAEYRPPERDGVFDVDGQGSPLAKVPANAAEPKIRHAVSLSEREKEIMHCLMGGHSNKLIARQLHISEATVKVHVKALLRKMQVANRTQAAICALHLVRQAEHSDRIEDASHVSVVERNGSSLALATC